MENRLSANNVLKHILQVESAHMIILNYLHNSNLIMTKRMSFLDANFSEDLRVLKQYAVYTIWSVNFHCFFKQLIKIITCTDTVCLFFSLFHCVLLKKTELVNQDTHGREGGEKTTIRSANIFFSKNNFCCLFQQLQAKIQLAYKAAVYESEQTTHILNNKGQNSVLHYCLLSSLANGWIWHI